MSDRRTAHWATTSARVVIGAAAAVGLAVVAVAAVAAPWPTVARQPVSLEAAPAPSANVLACTGGLLALGRDAADAGIPIVAAAQTVISGVPAADEPASISTLRGAGALSEGGQVLSAAPQNGARVDVAASGAATASDADLRGFAASACRQPLMESWLVGGASTTGSADIVLLANPGAVPATVQLTVYGTTGPVVPAGGEKLVVPAGSHLAVPLAGLALGNASPVVRVSAAGAPVTAALQTSLTRTLVAVGVDQVGAVAGTSTDVVIAGVAVDGTPVTAGAAETSTLVRILSPLAATQATVTVTAVGQAQPAAAPQVVPVGAGTPVEVDLSGLPAGAYTVRVESDVPVVAAARQVAGTGTAADYAWYTPSPALVASSLFATPAGPAPTLTLVNDGDAEASVQLAPVAGGAAAAIVVPAHGSVATTLAPGAVYALDPGAGEVHAGVSIGGAGGLAAFPVWPSDAAAPAITVYP
jgi:hypothetical protein